MPRRDNDAYYTPRDAVAELIKRRPDIGAPGRTVIEPCCGDRAIADVFAARGACVVTNDLVPTIEADFHGDAGDAAHWRAMVDELGHETNGPEGWRADPVDWVITNPPFVSAFDILKRAHEHAAHGVAFFLRLSFLEPTEDRGPWLALTPPDELIVLPRISFTGDGATDSVTCAWMIWYKDFARATGEGGTRGIQIVPKPSRVDERQDTLWQPNNNT